VLRVALAALLGVLRLARPGCGPVSEWAGCGPLAFGGSVGHWAVALPLWVALGIAVVNEVLCGGKVDGVACRPR
jgi:hypothetical protein